MTSTHRTHPHTHPRIASPARRGPQRRPRAGWLVGAAIVAVIALAAIVAIAVSGGDSSTGQDATGVEQYRAVTMTGTALDPLDQSTGVDPAVGVIAPSLSGQSFDGTAVSYAPGRPTLLVFLAHWCVHCRAEVPVLVDWQAAGKAPAGLDVIGVATGTDATKPNYPPSAWLSGTGFAWPVMADSTSHEAATAYGLTSFPYFVLVDAQGAVVARASGELTPTALDALVAQVTR